jgi:hypothetical protein
MRVLSLLEVKVTVTGDGASLGRAAGAAITGEPDKLVSQTQPPRVKPVASSNETNNFLSFINL